jgi:hypothetical protein
MTSDTEVGIRITQRSTFLIRVDGFSPTRRREKCYVTFLDEETSFVVATQSFDSGFVRQASLGQLMNIMSVGYRVGQATRALHLTTRNVSRALTRGSQRETQLKDSSRDATCS